MPAKVASTLAHLAAVIVIGTSLTGCGSNIEGTYAGSGNSFFEKMTIKSDKKVEITFMGMTKEGTYAVDGKNIKITMGGGTPGSSQSMAKAASRAEVHWASTARVKVVAIVAQARVWKAAFRAFTGPGMRRLWGRST